MSPGWVFVSAAWLVPAILASLRQYAQSLLNTGQPPGWRSLVWEGGDWLLYALLTPAVFWLGRRYPLQRGAIARHIPIHLGASILLCAAWAMGGVGLSWLLFRTGPYGGGALSWFFTSLPFGVAVYFAVLGVEHAMFYLTQSARLEAQLADARLGALRMQMQPHFLFNSLNAITVIVRDQDTATATRLLEQLGEMLRRVMRADRPQEVPLADELDFVRQYLAIETVRFSDRLRPVFDVPPELRNALVPEFLLQPLVENAVRHGLAQRLGATLLRIEARRDGDELVLTVVDDGPGAGAAVTEGVGLGNTRERLATLYGSRARLNLARTAEGGTRVTVRLPYRELERPHA
jgi:signal transduction histidine kinase